MIYYIAAVWTLVCTYAQTLIHKFTTLWVRALLRGKARIDPYHLMTSPRSLIRKDIEKCAPTCVMYTFCKIVVLHHPRDIQVLYTNSLIPPGIAFCYLEVEITSLTPYLQMGLRDVASRFLPLIAILLAP